MSAKVRDLLGSILIFIFVAVLWSERNYMTPFGGIFPDVVMGCLFLLVVVTFILSFTPFRTIKDGDGAAAEKGEKHWREMIVVAVILLAWATLLRYLGFALTGVIGFGSITWYLSEQRNSARCILTAVIIALAMTYLLVFIFEYLLKVPLPPGRIFG